MQPSKNMPSFPALGKPCRRNFLKTSSQPLGVIKQRCQDRHSSLQAQKGLRECDLIFNHEFQIEPFDFERHPRFKACSASHGPRRYRLPNGALNFPLRGDTNLFQKFPHFPIEDVFIQHTPHSIGERCILRKHVRCCHFRKTASHRHPGSYAPQSKHSPNTLIW